MLSIAVSFADVIGLIGVTCLLSAFYLLNINKLTAAAFSYQLLNLIGSSLILFSLFFNWNLSAAMIEVIWMLISLIGIYRIFFKKN